MTIQNCLQMIMDVNNIKPKDLLRMLEQLSYPLSRQRLYDKMHQPNMTVSGALHFLDAMGYELIVREMGKPYRDDEVRIDLTDDFIPNNSERMKKAQREIKKSEDETTATEVYLAYNKLTFNKTEVCNILGISYPTLQRRYGKYFDGKTTVTLSELTELLNDR